MTTGKTSGHDFKFFASFIVFINLKFFLRFLRRYILFLDEVLYEYNGVAECKDNMLKVPVWSASYLKLK